MRLCHLNDLAEGAARGFDPQNTGQDTLLVVRQGERLFAYADACPHHGTPMDWRQDACPNAAGQLQLSTHAVAARRVNPAADPSGAIGGGFPAGGALLVAAAVGESLVVLVHLHGHEAQHPLIAAVLGLELVHERGIALELDQVVEARGLLLDGIRELAHPPALFMADLAIACFDQVFELLYRLLCLVLRQNGSKNEDGFVPVGHVTISVDLGARI